MRLFRWLLIAIFVAAFFSGRTAVMLSSAVSDRVSERSDDGRYVRDASGRSDAERPRLPRLDIYGNPIDEAVTDYRIDGRGDRYDRNAPDSGTFDLSAPGT